jgi:molybdate transport system permease protein
MRTVMLDSEIGIPLGGVGMPTTWFGRRCQGTVDSVPCSPVSNPRRAPRWRRAPRAARSPWSAVSAALGLTALASACAPRVGVESDAPELLVLAASSLADVLPELSDQWTESGRGVVHFSFDATSRLAPQAVAGARADVFVAADDHWVRWLVERGVADAGSARVVARNELVAVVPLGRPAPSRPSELADVQRIAVGGENVPVGRYAREALATEGVWEDVSDRVVSGGSARGVLEWVARGEVGAGIVYRTDALAEPEVEVAFAFDESSHDPIRYWAVPLTSGESTAEATDFVDFLEGSAAAAALSSAGFRVAEVGTRLAQDSVDPSVGDLPSVASAVRLSLLVAFLATLVGLAPAIGLGWVLARRDFRGKAVVSTAVLAPLVIPPVVTGFLLLTVLGSQSPVGRALAGLGLPVPFTLIGAAVAAFVVGLPLYVLSIRGAFEAVDPLYEELSWTLGVPPRHTFFRISLPLAIPGIAAGATLAFARSLGEFGATVVLAGNVEGSTRTIALAVYTLLEAPSGRESTWVLVGASVALSLLALVGYEALSRRQRQRLNDDVR